MRVQLRPAANLSKSLALASVFGALYAVLVVALAPISFLPFQVRFADALLPLAILFGWPAALGLSIGAAVGNMTGGLLGGFFPASSIAVDVAGGSLANLLAALVAWKLGARGQKTIGKLGSWFLVTVSQTLLVSIIVGSYLGAILSLPLEVSIPGVLFGSIIAINIVGFLLLLVVGRPSTLQSLIARGLTVSATSDEANPDLTQA